MMLLSIDKHWTVRSGLSNLLRLGSRVLQHPRQYERNNSKLYLLQQSLNLPTLSEPRGHMLRDRLDPRRSHPRQQALSLRASPYEQRCPRSRSPG